MLRLTSYPIVPWRASLATTLVCCSIVQHSAQSIQLADGTTYFENVPRLENARTTFNSARVVGAAYYFALHIPEDAGEPLRRVVFKQQEGVDRVRFNLGRTRAYTDKDRKRPIGIAEVTANELGAISIYFDPPVSPGGALIIELRPYRNPRVSGVYLFGVTAFPRGERAHGQFLGYGRLHFYDHFWHPLRWGH